MQQKTIILDIEGTPYSIETNLTGDLDHRDIYATIYKVGNGRPVWQMEYRGVNAITDAVMAINEVVGEPVAHRLKKRV